MTGAGVVFQCGACRALGSAREVVVGSDGTSVGLCCTACGATTWLPVAASGSVRAEAHPPSASARALPPASSATLPSSTTSVSAPSVAGGEPADDESVSHDDAAAHGVLAPPVSTRPTSAGDVGDARNARRTEDAPAAAPAGASGATPATARAFDDDVSARIVERWKAHGAVTPAQAPLGARLERLMRGAWNDETEHKALLKAAAVAGELAFVGGRYRAVLDVVRDEPRARAAQQELLTLAMLTMKSPRDLEGTGAKRGSSKLYVAALVVATIGFLGAVGYLLFHLVESFRRLGELG